MDTKYTKGKKSKIKEEEKKNEEKRTEWRIGKYSKYRI